MYTISSNQRIVKAKPDAKKVLNIPKLPQKWKELAPMTQKARLKLHEKCSDKCFLEVLKSKTGKLIFKYPICTGGLDCKLKCQGLKAAINATFRVENKYKNKPDGELQVQKPQKIRKKAISILKKECLQKK